MSSWQQMEFRACPFSYRPIGARKRNMSRDPFKISMPAVCRCHLVWDPSGHIVGYAVHFFLRPSYVFSLPFSLSLLHFLSSSFFLFESLVGIVPGQTAVINRAWQSLLAATGESFGKIDSFEGVAKRETYVFISQFFHKRQKYNIWATQIIDIYE